MFATLQMTTFGYIYIYIYIYTNAYIPRGKLYSNLDIPDYIYNVFFIYKFLAVRLVHCQVAPRTRGRWHQCITTARHLADSSSTVMSLICIIYIFKLPKSACLIFTSTYTFDGIFISELDSCINHIAIPNQ